MGREDVPQGGTCGGGGNVRLLSSLKNMMELAREPLARSWSDLMLLA